MGDRFSLPEAINVEGGEDRDGAIMARIGDAAAHDFQVTPQNEKVIGASSWSETILKMVDDVRPMRSDKTGYVVQSLGGMGNPTVQARASRLTTRLARLTGGEACLLSAPGVAHSREAELVLANDPYIREESDLFGKITLSIVGIGAVEPSSMLAQNGNVFLVSELAEVVEPEGVGDIGLRFFDKIGCPVKTPLDDRANGMTLEEKAGTDRVIALAGGRTKTHAIRNALVTRAVDALIKDMFTAERLQETGPHHGTEAN
ncbi:MAG: sugar-binding transcriptional regulator [Albidovulum sp.]|nr:sugar-binding transcriptional regulator [Albidovulum sp.]